MVTPFKVVAKNEERGQPQASYLRFVKVYLPGDTVVELQKGRRVLVKAVSLISARFEQMLLGNHGCLELLTEFFVTIGEWETDANSSGDRKGRC